MLQILIPASLMIFFRNISNKTNFRSETSVFTYVSIAVCKATEIVQCNNEGENIGEES